MKLAAVFALALGGCVTGPPQRDVFLPPYAEKGCWARLYEQPRFGGLSREVAGLAFVESLAGSTVQVPNMQETEPQPLFGEIRSLAVGPHARLTGYAEPLFRTPTLELAPGARVEDLSTIAFYEKVRSFTLRCEA